MNWQDLTPEERAELEAANDELHSARLRYGMTPNRANAQEASDLAHAFNVLVLAAEKRYSADQDAAYRASLPALEEGANERLAARRAARRERNGINRWT